MREISFRYWHASSMLEVGSIEFFMSGSVHVNNEFVSGILLQFIGLLDKNGKQIYEGDVIKLKDGTIKYVRWNDSFALFGLSFKRGATGNFENGMEVIGNIYENPELLK